MNKSFAMEMLEDYKKANKRLFIVLVITLVMWFLTIGYLVYTLNDIGVIEETATQEITDVNSIHDIVNVGDIDGEN